MYVCMYVCMYVYMYVWWTIVIDKIQPSALFVYLHVGSPGRSLMHTGGCTLDTQWNALH